MDSILDDAHTPIASNLGPPGEEESGVQGDDVNISTVMRGEPRSNIWLQFTKQIVNRVHKAKCNHCGKYLSGNPQNGTKHLHNHYKKSCNVRKALVEQTMITNIDQVEGRKNLAPTFNQDNARRELARMIVMHEYPLSMVEHPGFRRYSNTLQPLFKCPSRNTTKSDIISSYLFEKTNVIQLIEKQESRLAITTDMWTSNHQRKGYMVITAHYVDVNWVLNSLILRFAYVPCPHTKEVLGGVLLDSLMDWNIDNRIYTIALDNCSTNDAIIKEMRNFLPLNSLILSGKTLYMRCCAHILNLIVKDGLSVIANGTKMIRESISFWTATPRRLERFLDTTKQLKIDAKK